MEIEIDKRGGSVGPGSFEDADGYAMPLPPGTGPRRIPRGAFPTGPDIGTSLPDVVATDQHGRRVDLDADRHGRPAVLVFFRSAVW